MPERRITIKVDEDLHKALKYISVIDNTTLQDMIIKSIENEYSSRIDEAIKNI